MKQIHHNEKLENQQVFLDNGSWKNCTFTNCELVINVGYFDVVDCHFSKCRLVLSENAERIAKFVEAFTKGRTVSAQRTESLIKWQ